MNRFSRIYLVDQPSTYRLVKKTPEGLGTDAVESLSSYLTRLAGAHWLTPTNLYKALAESESTSAAKSLTRSTRIDGFSKRSREVASVLNESTAIDIEFADLTLNAWRGGFAVHGCGLLRDHLAWCEECFCDDRKRRRERFNRLQWSIRRVEICPVHNRLLQHSCIYCGAKQSPIVANAQVGFCQHCGEDVEHRKAPRKQRKLQPSKEQRWKSLACIELLSATQQGLRLERKTFLDQFQNFLADYGGAPKTMAKELNLRVDVIRSWVRRNHNPQFDVFLDFCYRLDVPIVSFFRKSGSLHIHRPRVQRETPSRKAPPLSEEYLADAQKEVKAVLARSKDIQKLLDVASAAGLTVRQMQYHFPDLYSEVVQRIFERRAREKCERDDLRVDCVRRHALSLARRGVYPSQRKLLNRQDVASSDLRQASVRAALREIQDAFLRHHPEFEADSKFMLHLKLSRRRMPTEKEAEEQSRLQRASGRLR